MLGIEELKKSIKITETTVECPVKGCNEKVVRQRKRFTKKDIFRCPEHNIYISPSTFEYQSELENLLWKDKPDIDLFNSIKSVKRESRIARDNSEDALSWNVLRFLERNNLITDLLKETIGIYENNAEVIYWAFSQSQQKLWDMLYKGRKEFELVPSKGSEPDIIILGNKTLVIIEAKLGATNKTVPSKPYVEEKYVSGDNRWWNKAFHSNFKTVAIDNKKYELSRFWLIGSWMAKKLNLDFYLINLTLSNRENDIEQVFGKHIIQDNSRVFKRITWEQIYEYIVNTNLANREKAKVIRYFKNKTIGYNGKGILQQAFSITSLGIGDTDDLCAESGQQKNSYFRCG